MFFFNYKHIAKHNAGHKNVHGPFKIFCDDGTRRATHKYGAIYARFYFNSIQLKTQPDQPNTTSDVEENRSSA